MKLSDCESDRNSKNNAKSERNLIVSINALEHSVNFVIALFCYITIILAFSTDFLSQWYSKIL